LAKSPINDKVNALSSDVRQKLIDGAVAGESITEMSKRLGVEFMVAQRWLWRSRTLPWQGAKNIITRRLRSLRTARRQTDRDRLVKRTWKSRSSTSILPLGASRTSWLRLRTWWETQPI